jgi:fructokinase
MQTKFVLLGEALIDRAFGANVVESKNAGGGALNASVGISRLGNSVSYVSHVGNDDYGNLIRDYLKKNNVQLLAEDNSTVPTSIANAEIQADGSARYEFKMQFDISNLKQKALPLIKDAEAVHTGSIGSFLLPGCEDIYDLFKFAKEDALKSYDPNCRPSINGNHAQVLDIVERFVSLSTVVKASDEDIEWLYPGESMGQVAQKWINLGPVLVAITRGPEGAFVLRSSGMKFELPGKKVQVQDTIGAGDSFMATILSSLIGHKTTGIDSKMWVSAINDDEIRAILERAVLFSADTCTRTGANPPDLEMAVKLTELG